MFQMHTLFDDYIYIMEYYSIPYRVITHTNMIEFHEFKDDYYILAFEDETGSINQPDKPIDLLMTLIKKTRRWTYNE